TPADFFMMFAPFLLSLTLLASFSLGDQAVLQYTPFRFKLLDYSNVLSGRERVSPIHPAGSTARSPFVYRNSTWSQPLSDAQKAVVKAAVNFEWRDAADCSNGYMEYTFPKPGYYAFSTKWHIVSGHLYHFRYPAKLEFVTAVVPESLDNGFLNGLLEIVFVDDEGRDR
ncbi:hypothetical protein DFQ26_000937, partial [Actinomortierella ambigua]